MIAQKGENTRACCHRGASKPGLAKPPISTATERRLKVHACQALSARSTICGASLPSSRATICLVPGFAGASLSSDSKDALWDKFFTGAPRRQAAVFRVKRLEGATACDP